jgi:hypothetical protein
MTILDSTPHPLPLATPPETKGWGGTPLRFLCITWNPDLLLLLDTRQGWPPLECRTLLSVLRSLFSDPICNPPFLILRFCEPSATLPNRRNPFDPVFPGGRSRRSRIDCEPDRPRIDHVDYLRTVSRGASISDRNPPKLPTRVQVSSHIVAPMARTMETFNVVFDYRFDCIKWTGWIRLHTSNRD